MPQGLRAEAAVPVVDSKKRPLIPPKAASAPLRGSPLAYTVSDAAWEFVGSD